MATPNRPLISDPVLAKHRAFEIAKRCQDDHMDGNGWADTGQHFTVTRDGIVLEGRTGSLAAAMEGMCVRGAHAADGGIDYNDSFGIECEGTYTADVVPPRQMRALVDLLAWLCFKCRIDTSTILGHRDTGIATACPGDWLHSQLPSIREQAHNAKIRLATNK